MDRQEILSLITHAAEPCPKSSNYGCIRLDSLTNLFESEIAKEKQASVEEVSARYEKIIDKKESELSKARAEGRKWAAREIQQYFEPFKTAWQRCSDIINESEASHDANR